MRILRIVMLAATAAVLPAAVPAQTAFVQGGYGSDVRRFSADLDQRVFDGRAATVILGGGAFVSPRWSVGLELDAGADSTDARSVTVPVSGLPATVTTTFRLERRTLSVLAGLHTGTAGPVAVTVYGGLAFNSIRREIASDAPPIVVTSPVEPSVFVDRTAGPIAGVDLAVTVAPHVAIVGGLRAQGLSLAGDLSGFSVRPFAGARLRF